MISSSNLKAILSNLDERLKRLEHSHAPGGKVDRTSLGTFFRPDQDFTAGGKGDIDWQGQYVPGKSYKKHAVTIRKTDAEMDDGYLAGTYIALQDVGPNDAAPGVDEPQTAVGVVQFDGGGGISGIDISANPGAGYSAAPKITIAGDGTGATAVATVNGDGSLSVVITNPGTGYTNATATFDAPGNQKWEDFAEFRSRRFTFRMQKQAVIIDVGRDGQTITNVSVFRDYTDEKQGTYYLDCALLTGVAGTDAAVIKAREHDVCIDFGFGPVKMKELLMAGAPYFRNSDGSIQLSPP